MSVAILAQAVGLMLGPDELLLSSRLGRGMAMGSVMLHCDIGPWVGVSISYRASCSLACRVFHMSVVAWRVFHITGFTSISYALS